MPIEIFLKSLFEGSSWYALIIPQLNEPVSSCSYDKFLLAFIDQTDVVDSFFMGLDLQFLLDSLWRNDDFIFLVGEVMNVDRQL